VVKATKYAENTEPTAYNKISTRSNIGICWISSGI